MLLISFTGSKTFRNLLLTLVALASFTSITASILTSALSESNIRLSDEGFLVYGSLPDLTKAHLFRNYMNEYDREYSTRSEEITRYDLFKQSLIDADKLNADEKADGGTAVFGITVFADMSQQEFQSQYLSLDMPKRSSKKNFQTEANEKYVPYTGSRTSMDWRNMTTPIKNQGRCGSCWAHQAVSQIESDSIKVGLLNTESILSVMQLVRCTYPRDGCGGGWTSTAWDYVTSVGGITFADYYPYDLEAPATCDKAKNDFTVTVTSWHEMDGLNDNEQQMIDYVLSKGTLAVAVDASLWHSYRGGIFSSCTGKPINFNHGVNIVGVNTKERYWIIRNSWGTWWGENGYMRLAMGNNQCGVAYWAGYTKTAAVKPSSPSSPRYLPTYFPTTKPSPKPTRVPTSKPTTKPTPVPTARPSSEPTQVPSKEPTNYPTFKPTKNPTKMPTAKPSSAPTRVPTAKPTSKPSPVPSRVPTVTPTAKPSSVPTRVPTAKPTSKPSSVPSRVPTVTPTAKPSSAPTRVPTAKPTSIPTAKPTSIPTAKPSSAPTRVPTVKPTSKPSSVPSRVPTVTPTAKPSSVPTRVPTAKPSTTPSSVPTRVPTVTPTAKPSSAPTRVPTAKPTATPSLVPTRAPTVTPTAKPSPVLPRTPSLSPTITATASLSPTPTSSRTTLPTETQVEKKVSRKLSMQYLVSGQPTETSLRTSQSVEVSSFAESSKGTTGTSSAISSACSAVAALVGFCLAAVVGFLYWKKSQAVHTARSMNSLASSGMHTQERLNPSPGNNVARPPSPVRLL